MSYLPKVQALAAQGVTFKNSFVNFSLCAPSRSSFLTGQASHNDGIKSNKENKGGGWSAFEHEEENTLPLWLQKAGHQTALVGKYLNGYGKGKPPRLSSVSYWGNSVGGWFGLGTIPDKRVYVPPGWDLWYAFTKIRYFDYQINDNARMVAGCPSIAFGREPLTRRLVFRASENT